MRTNHKLFEDPNSLAAAEHGFANGLDVQIERHRRIDIVEEPGLAADLVLADVQSPPEK
jgi:hypothetical protein